MFVHLLVLTLKEPYDTFLKWPSNASTSTRIGDCFGLRGRHREFGLSRLCMRPQITCDHSAKWISRSTLVGRSSTDTKTNAKPPTATKEGSVTWLVLYIGKRAVLIGRSCRATCMGASAGAVKADLPLGDAIRYALLRLALAYHTEIDTRPVSRVFAATLRRDSIFMSSLFTSLRKAVLLIVSILKQHFSRPSAE